MRSDDISSLFQPPDKPEIGMRQGTLLAWNPSTGANTVELAGQSFTDLPLLTSGTLAMAVGDVIALLRFGTTYFILGTIRNAGVGTMGIRSARTTYTPGTGDFVTSGSYVSPATSGPVVEDVYIGKSRQALVMLSAQMTTTDCNGYCSFSVNGASTINAEDFRGCLFFGKGAQSTVTKISLLTAADGVNEGLHTFTTRVRRSNLGASPVYAIADRDLTIIPF